MEVVYIVRSLSSTLSFHYIYIIFLVCLSPTTQRKSFYVYIPYIYNICIVRSVYNISAAVLFSVIKSGVFFSFFSVHFAVTYVSKFILWGMNYIKGKKATYNMR